MALTKISRGLLNTGISDSSDATAVTITSDEDFLVRQTSADVYDTNSGSTKREFWGNQFSGSNNTASKTIIGSASNLPLVGGATQNASSKFIVNSYMGFGSSDQTAGGEDGFITFYTSSGGAAGTEKMRIDSSGRVGISESAPNNALLHLNQVHAADANSSSDYSAGTNLALWIENSASSGYPRIFNKSDASTVAVVTNYENNKHAYWGEPSDTRTYYFRGSSSSGVNISGSLTKGSGSFKIDHPLESKKDTHDLVHSFVESPQANNIYKGVAVLENGTATINLDTASGMSEGTYILLNTNTSCFTSNESDWDAVKGSVSGNILTISCQNTSSTAKVSWMVIGERQDQHMIEANWTDENGKVIVEPLKDVNA
jgi:hypothetical protein